jgi:hypothetical protein
LRRRRLVFLLAAHKDDERSCENQNNLGLMHRSLLVFVGLTETATVVGWTVSVNAQNGTLS